MKYSHTPINLNIYPLITLIDWLYSSLYTYICIKLYKKIKKLDNRIPGMVRDTNAFINNLFCKGFTGKKSVHFLLGNFCILPNMLNSSCCLKFINVSPVSLKDLLFRTVAQLLKKIQKFWTCILNLLCKQSNRTSGILTNFLRDLDQFQKVPSLSGCPQKLWSSKSWQSWHFPDIFG